MGDHNLVSTCSFHGQEYLFKLNVLGNILEILITDKCSGEEWQCSYDATYIENLTHKTGNYKQFDVFVAMIRSGLLRTSESVSLDLLSFEDLELLRSRKISNTLGNSSGNNKRYLIVTYAVEFDKIRYPLPLEYCGFPDPVLLQGTIRRLEQELLRTREELDLRLSCDEGRKIHYLQKKVDELTEENLQLQEEIRYLHKELSSKRKGKNFFKAVNNLEKSVVNERNSHHDLVEQLKTDKMLLAKELEKVKNSERCLKERLNLRAGVRDLTPQNRSRRSSSDSMKVMYCRGEPPPNRSRQGRSKNINIKVVERKSSSERSMWESPSKGKKLSKKKSTSKNSIGQDFSDLSQTSRKTVKNRSQSRASSNSSNSSRLSRKTSDSGKTVKKKDYQSLEKKVVSLEKMLHSVLYKQLSTSPF